MWNTESHLTISLSSTKGMSRGRLYMNLTALQTMDSKALNSFLFVQHPQIGRAYVAEGKTNLKYRSKSELISR